MKKEDLSFLFRKYLNRDFTQRELLIHGPKNYDAFEIEIANCKERAEILKKTEKPTNYKIAFLLSGHIRKNSILQGILKFCKDYKYDVFIHTWDNIGLKGSETNLDDKLNKELVIKNINDIPNVVKYEIENNKSFINNLTTSNKYFNYSSPEVFIKSQLYSINKSYKLMEEHIAETNVDYKAVFKFRFDCDMFQFSIDDDIIHDINNNRIIFFPNSDNQHTHPDFATSCWACNNMYYKYNLKNPHIFEHTNIVCDLFSYGSVSSMKDYCSLYNVYDEMNESFYEGNMKSMIENGKNVKFVDGIHKLNGYKGHIDSVYYYNCSYPERMLQKLLNNYMLIESKKIKLKLVR
jgi:hypothetical protein